jgi:hypothetical protein
MIAMIYSAQQSGVPDLPAPPDPLPQSATTIIHKENKDKDGCHIQ